MPRTSHATASAMSAPAIAATAIRPPSIGWSEAIGAVELAAAGAASPLPGASQGGVVGPDDDRPDHAPMERAGVREDAALSKVYATEPVAASSTSREPHSWFAPVTRCVKPLPFENVTVVPTGTR